MNIPLEDLQVEVINPRPAGGQQVGSVNYIIKVTHLPTNTVAICGDARSQHKNREICMEMISIAVSKLGFKYD